MTKEQIKNTSLTDTLQVSVVSPEKILFEGEVESVHLPGEKGRFEVFKQHAPIISSLVKGKVVCKGKENFEVEIKSGFVEVAKNSVSVCIEQE